MTQLFQNSGIVRTKQRNKRDKIRFEIEYLKKATMVNFEILVNEISYKLQCTL